MKGTAGDISLYYESTGEGTPIVLTHGIGGSADDWTELTPMLATKYRVLTWDVRGHARSDRPAGGYSIGQFAADLAALLDTLGIPKAVIAGSSMGGTIVQRFILDFPEKTSAAVIMSTSSEVNERGQARWAQQADIAEREGTEAFFRRSRPAEHTDEFVSQHPEILEAEQRRLRNNPDGAVYAAISRAVSSYNYTSELESVRLPTLVLVGDKDTTTPPGGSVIISRRIPGAELHILPGLGHGLSHEDPKQAFDLISAFLDRVLPAAG